MSDFRLPRPAEGWLPLVLVLVIALTLGWAIDEPGWVNGNRALTDSLPMFAVLGVAFGFAGPKVGWGRWTTHLVGAAFAGLLVPVFAGLAEAPGSSVAEAFRVAATGTVQAYLDLAWLGRRFTSQEVHYIVVLGGLVWGTSQFLAYAVFGHRRPLNGVIVAGLVLLANMSLTSLDQLGRLVAFAGASLLLLIGMHVFDERATWLRRRIGDPGTIASLYLRGGSVFIVVAVLGSLLLTDQAASAPLAGAWSGVNDQLIQVGQQLSRLFPVGGDLRSGGGVSFGSSARIAAQWFSDSNVAFVATLPAGEKADQKWTAATYDTFVLDGWEQTGIDQVPVAAGQPLLAGTPEQVSADLTRQVVVQVRPEDFRDRSLLAPGMPISVSQDSSVLLSTTGWFAGVDLPGARSGYTVAAGVLRLSDTDVISANRLRAASTDYPADIVRRYTAVPAGAMGPDATDLLATIRRTAVADNPYDLAVAIVSYLKDSAHFTYTTDLRNVPCDAASAVECFARTRQGYCLHYASTMAILLRAANPDNPIPTRLVQGFLPGTLAGTTETVLNNRAHAWVEVYFPGYGWIPFDPTGGGVGQASTIQPGPPVVSPTPRSSSTPGGTEAPDPSRRINPAPGGDGSVTPGGQPADRTLLIVITVMLGLAILVLAAAAWARGPRGEINPDRAWQSMARAASRFGFAPRPTQTPYEYAATLGDLVPVARADLHTVAEAKVETVYARVQLGSDRLRALREAYGRLRVSLLRLLVRRARPGRRR